MRDEVRIVWLRPPETLPRYVREVLDEWANFRARRWRFGRGNVVAYAELAAAAPSDRYGRFSRRVFHLAGHDPYEGLGCPVEAVDPLTVRPGVPGLQNGRAWGNDLSGSADGGEAPSAGKACLVVSGA